MSGVDPGRTNRLPIESYLKGTRLAAPPDPTCPAANPGRGKMREGAVLVNERRRQRAAAELAYRALLDGQAARRRRLLAEGNNATTEGGPWAHSIM